ncbi:MAG TPA: response regulator, partial [Myxococcota bacterium]|nr:response regulator [Myxococcota bacterium]
IWPYSELGVGTTFKIYLPETNRMTPTVGTIRPSPTSLAGSETVLLVEDDSAVRQTMRSILARQGYRVLEAANGGEALLICEQHQASIELLVTDLVMPRMSGRHLATRLTSDRPQLKVLFVSGYTELAAHSQTLLADGAHYLAKPVTPTSLALKVREVLDTPA